MNKLELQTKHMIEQTAKIENEELREHQTKMFMKSFAIDLLNMVEGLRQNDATMPVIKSMVEQYGISFNGKSKKFV